ncbi:MAG: methyltransferase domain-containing protein [Deltaproteobacteria bacterium]|nr:MAG: methyltransferase domain-containing protein [Deltaproteobacteria bacterium]
MRDAGARGEYVGVDIVEHPAWRRIEHNRDLRARFLVHDAHALDSLDGGPFDLALAVTTFEHFADDALVMRGLARKLARGGHAIVIVPSEYSPALYWRHGYRTYRRGRIPELARDAGLEVEETFPIGGLAGFIFHAAWFNVSRAAVLSGKAALAVAAGGRSRARRWLARPWKALDNTMFWHQRFALGRRAHVRANVAAARIDERLPILPALYGYILRVP